MDQALYCILNHISLSSRSVWSTENILDQLHARKSVYTVQLLLSLIVLIGFQLKSLKLLLLHSLLDLANLLIHLTFIPTLLFLFSSSSSSSSSCSSSHAPGPGPGAGSLHPQAAGPRDLHQRDQVHRQRPRRQILLQCDGRGGAERHRGRPGRPHLHAGRCVCVCVRACVCVCVCRMCRFSRFQDSRFNNLNCQIHIQDVQ